MNDRLNRLLRAALALLNQNEHPTCVAAALRRALNPLIERPTCLCSESAVARPASKRAS